MLPTYQNAGDGALESLIEKEPPKEYGAVTTEDRDGDNSLFSKKNKVKTGTVFVLSLVIAVFLLRSVFASPQAANNTYNSVGVNPDGFLPPPSSVQGVIASSDVADSIVYAQPDSVSTDVEASYIVEETPASAVTENITPAETGDEPSYVEDVTVAVPAVEPVEEEPVAAYEEPAATEADQTAVIEAVEEPAVEEVVVIETPEPTPEPTTAPEPTQAPSKLVVRPSQGPTAAMQINPAQLKRMRSDSRLAPLSMSL